jgi:hypothetical protein
VRHKAAVSKEIIETEKSYVESLEILVKVRTAALCPVACTHSGWDTLLTPLSPHKTQKYMGPLVASGVLDKDERATIFSNIPSLLSINNALLRVSLLPYFQSETQFLIPMLPSLSLSPSAERSTRI